MAKLKPEHLKELSDLRLVCVNLIDLVSRYEDLGETGRQLRDGVEQIHMLQDLRQMRSLVGELRAMMAALQPAQRADIEREILARTGVSVASGRATDQGRIKRVVRRGKILNEREYHMLRARIDELSGDHDRSGEAERLQALVDDFS